MTNSLYNIKIKIIKHNKITYKKQSNSSYQAAAIQTERLSALLNAGQSVILSAGAADMQESIRIKLK
jgi:ABC-type transport system involved in Fe-S cluster assembly fused permease/ATPase subunit